MTLNIVDLQPVQKGVPRDGYDRPLVVPKAGGKPKAHTRTTTFIDCIEDKSTLTTWKARMVLVGASAKPSLLRKVQELWGEFQAIEKAGGEDAKGKLAQIKRQLNALSETAFEASGANDKREAGSHLHELSEYVDRGEELPERTAFGVTTDQDRRDMAAYREATTLLSVVHIEQIVVCNELCTAGTPDRVSRYEGPGPTGGWLDANLITDLKTGSVEYGELKMASQLATYSRAEVYDHKVFPVDVHDKKAFAKWKKTEFPAELAATAYTPLPNVNQDWGLIINLPAGSGHAELHWVDLNKGWAAAQLALDIRAMRSTKKAMLPFLSA